MISMVRLVEGRYDYGCVMARIDEEAARKILDFNNRTITNEMLYEEEGYGYGREITPHITIKFGLTESYTEEQMKQLLSKVVPFNVEIGGVSIFENEKFDIVKFDIEGKEIRELNEMFSQLPNEDKHPIYHPHLSLAYVKRGLGQRFTKTPSKHAFVPVNMIEYSDGGSKSYYHL